MPTTTLECYTAGTYKHSIQFKVDSQYHDPQGSVYGPPGSVSREVDPIGLEGLGLKGLLGLLVVGRDVKKKNRLACSDRIFICGFVHRVLGCLFG